MAAGAHIPEARARGGEGLEYYLQRFVWGKLQRTDQEIPYLYGVYGTPEWYTNRVPIFDWIAYGGVVSLDGDALSVMPRDGLRQRLVTILPDPQIPWPGVGRFKLEFDRDGFAADEPIVTDKALNKLAFMLENRTQDQHVTRRWFSFPIGASTTSPRTAGE